MELKKKNLLHYLIRYDKTSANNFIIPNNEMHMISSIQKIFREAFSTNVKIKSRTYCIKRIEHKKQFNESTRNIPNRNAGELSDEED